MPDVEWYNFTVLRYNHIKYEWEDSTASAIFYLLQFDVFNYQNGDDKKEVKIHKDEAEARLHKLFAAPNDEYQNLIHKEYRKLAMFDGESYTPWPESGNDATEVYDLVSLKAEYDGEVTIYEASADLYSFDLTGLYTLTENSKNEEFLFAKADEMRLDNLSALSELLLNGGIREAEKESLVTMRFRVSKGSTTPMFISFECKDY